MQKDLLKILALALQGGVRSYQAIGEEAAPGDPVRLNW